MIRGTVALPVWNSKAIAWLCMESLCRQHMPSGGWELVVFEEEHSEQLGESFFRNYAKRLTSVGCERLVYYSAPDKYPLSQKWVMIARQAAITSTYFCLCAADNFYSPYMLREAEKNITESEWSVTHRGYFYDLHFDKVVRYELPGLVGLQMTAATERVRNFDMDEVNKGVDSWFSRQMGQCGTIMCANHWEGILCTNGLNNISTERYQHFLSPHPPFYETRKQLNNIVPEDISNRLKTLSRCLKLQ